MKKICFLVLVCFSFISLMSCRSEITLTAQKDGSVKVNFEGECGKYFESMIRSFSESENGPLFDVSMVKESFYTSGFKNVSVNAPNNVGLKINMISPEITFLQKSGLIICNKKDVFVRLSPDILIKFYNSADPEIVQVLDLLLAPVFNDEIMTSEEYLETISSFYGSEASKEISDCSIKLTLVSVNGQKKEASLPLVKLLTLSESIGF